MCIPILRKILQSYEKDPWDTVTTPLAPRMFRKKIETQATVATKGNITNHVHMRSSETI